MIERSNLLRSKELLKLDQDGKIPISDENFLELLDLRIDVYAHIVYNRKEVYPSLVEHYLNKLITPRYFRSKCREMTK